MQSKLPATGTTIFTVMSHLAATHQALNLGQGFPGFPIDPELIRLVEKAMRDGHNQYAPMAGWMPLREKLAEKAEGLYGTPINPETDITITAGATQAIFTAITALIHPGDEVILFAPAYDCYAPAVQLCGGIPKWVNLSWPDFAIPWDQVEVMITPRTRMILLNNPGNPAATVWPAEDLQRLHQLTQHTDIILLSDEVYEHLVFDEHTHESVLKFPELYKRSIAVFSFGKTFHATGWKLGYAIGPAVLMAEFRKVHQYNVFSVNTPAQVAMATYLEDQERYLSLSAFYQRKRDLFLSGLVGSRFRWKPAQGTYFQLLSFRELSDADEQPVAEDWTSRHGIASIPVSAFYPDQRNQSILRFCFAKEDDVLEKAADILRIL